MKYVSITAALGLGTALAASVGTAPVFAQTAATGAAAQGEDLSEIVVTARRVEERLQDVPISITVVTPQQLANQNVVNAQDLASFTPSLSAATNYGSENTSFAIRGFVQESGTAPAVGVIFGDVIAPRGASNGVPSGDGAGPGTFFDLQNVQVLKGPQGTLFGRNTTGGDVLLVPQKPTSVLEGYVEGTVGNYDLGGVQAVVNIPINDALRVRLGVDHQSRNGYAINTSGIGPSDYDDVNYTAVRASVVVDITPDIENYTIASLSNSNTHGSVQKMIAATASQQPFGPAAVAQLAVQGNNFYDLQADDTAPSSRVTQWQVINTTTWNASDALTLKNIVSYAELKDDLASALFGTHLKTPAVPPLRLPSFNYVFSNITPAPGDPTSHESTVTEEFRLQGHALGDSLTWQGGLYFDASRPLGQVGSQSPVAIACTSATALQCTDIEGYLFDLGSRLPPNSIKVGSVNHTTGTTAYRDAAAYAQSTYKFNEFFKLTGGLRYTTDDETNDDNQVTYNFLSPAGTATNPLPLPTVATPKCTNPATVANGCNAHYSLGTHAPTWLIDFDYTPTQDVLTYIKYARGYRAGTIAPNVTSPYNYIQAEKVDSYEVGMKTSFAEPVHGIFNVAAYYNDFRNQQLQLGFDPAPGATVANTAAPINAGKSRIYGAEVDASVTPFHGFKLDAAYAYLNTRIKEIPPFPTPAGSLYVIDGSQRVGDQLTLSPKNKYSITGIYTLPITEDIGKVSVGATFVHTDSQITTAYYTDRGSKFPQINTLGILQPTNLLNLNLAWESIANKPIDLLLFATNVTNEHYYTWIGGVGNSVGFETAQLGEPRMYGARIRVRFGK